MNEGISVHVGVSRVDPVHYGSNMGLHGPANDARAMHEIAVRAGFAARQPLLDADATAENVRRALLDAAAELSPGGMLLVTFAGHGTRVRSEEPALAGWPKESDGYREGFCLFDRIMFDAEVTGLLAEFAEDQRILAVLDCCHAGGALYEKASTQKRRRSIAPEAIRSISEQSAAEIVRAHLEAYTPREGVRLARYDEVRATVLMLAACADEQTTPDGAELGAFTCALCQALREDAPADYDALHLASAKRHPNRTPVLWPQNERTAAFRRSPPFRIWLADPSPAGDGDAGGVLASDAARAGDVQPPPGAGFCAQRQVVAPPLPPALGPERTNALIGTHRRWSNGTVLRYVLLPPARGGKGASGDREVVRAAFATWKSLGIGLTFREVADVGEAELRIGFVQGDGSWSYVGCDALRMAQHERTMNFGWRLSGRDGVDTALHEIGHALGLEHEHQSPFSGIEWDEEAVVRALAGSPNFWSPEQTRHNILRKLDEGMVRGTTWDPESVMHYPFEPLLVLRPEPYRSQGIRPPGGLSAADRAWVRATYPPIVDADLPRLKPGESRPLPTVAGAQESFRLEPEASAEYTLRTFGACDTTLTLFEGAGDEGRPVPEDGWHFLAGDDDGGEERNAEVRVKLRKGRQYRVRVLLRYADATRAASVMVW